MKSTLSLSLLVVLFSFSNSFAGENKSSDAQAVDQACTAEAQTASCGSEKVGTGLLKCLHAYRKEHKDFKPSEGCKTAMKKLHEDRKVKKAAESTTTTTK
jgi:hypothetical protein